MAPRMGHRVAPMIQLGVRRLLRRLSNHLYVDVGSPGATTFIAGMGRSGTTWVEAVVNHDFSYRIMLEPFLPHDVPIAAVFGLCPYVRSDDDDAARRLAAETILSGRTPRGTVDRDHRGRVFRRRIVKDVRCNLMLGYLKAVRPALPLVFVVRNPFAVTASWLRLKWGVVPYEDRLELDIMLANKELLADFPVIAQALRGIDRSDAFERTVFQWCLLHLVPLRQLGADQAHLIRYEDLIRRPLEAVDRLAAYLRIEIGGPSLTRALARTTATDFLHRGPNLSHADVLGDWKEVLSPHQLTRGHEILASFGLDHLYDEHGLPTPELEFRPPGRERGSE
jgi:hypothetical protein